MRVALLTTDNREHQRTYEETVPRFGPAVEALLQGLAGLPELEIHVIACTQRPMQAPEKLAQNIWFHLLHVPKIGWLRTGYQGCIRAIRKKLRELQPDLVHGQGTERECALSAVLSGFPNVVTIHGNMREVARSVGARLGSYLWCAARLEAFTLRRAGGVFCNSAYTEGVVRQCNQRTWRVPNALRRSFFDIPIPLARPHSRPMLLNVGNIARHKRQLELLVLCSRLRRAGLEFALQFVGAISRRSSYGRTFLEQMNEAAPLGFASYHPPQTVDDLIATLDRASALVHVPSEEAFGLVVAEGLARSLKFFGNRVGGIPDIAENVEGAELFPPGAEQPMEEALAEWVRNGSPRPVNSADKMRRRYHPDVIAQSHREIYREVLAAGS